MVFKLFGDDCKFEFSRVATNGNPAWLTASFSICRFSESNLIGTIKKKMYFLAKIVITALIVAGVSELARKYSFFAAALLSLPLMSILSFLWIYYDSRDADKIIELSYSTLWLIIPSLLFFILLPLLLKTGMKFYPAVLLSCLGMSGGYSLFIWLKKLLFS